MIIPLLVILLGLILYLPPWKNPKVNDLGNKCLWVGISISVWLYSRVHLP